MINNSSLQKWDRLEQKQLDTNFKNQLKYGMNCSEFEANAILNLVYEIYQPFFDNSSSIKPGQILFETVSIDNNPERPLKDCKMVTVVLTLDAGKEDLEMRRNSGVIGLRRHQTERMTNEAFQQGGLLTVEDLANRLLNCGERTVCRDLAYLRKENIVLPLRSTIKDMGKTISHKSLIVKHWLAGKEFSEIATATHHSVSSVANYVEKFKRIVSLVRDNYEISAIAFLIKLSPCLAAEYYKLYKECPIASSRQKEIDDLFKKKSFNN